MGGWGGFGWGGLGFGAGSPAVSSTGTPVTTADSGLVITARDIETGEQWSWQDDGGCPTLEKTMAGDGSITWSYDFTNGVDRLPPRHAHVEVLDGDGVIQTARLVRRQPPASDQCTAPCQLAAEGYAAALAGRKFGGGTQITPSLMVGPVAFGPVWTGTSLGIHPEDAVTYAVSQLGAPVEVGIVDESGFQLPDTENFQGRSAQDVANAMANFGAGLATPFVWLVKKGVFTWGPIDLAPRYEVLVANGAVITPTDDASRLYTRVIVIWQGNQAAIWPETISYEHLPSIVDLCVNAGAEVKTPAAALQLAQGLYARLGELELGWSWNITIPGTTAIEWIGHGPIAPWRLDASAMLRVPDLDPITRWGNKHPSPEALIITSLRYDGTANQLTGTCGEIRDPSQFVRKVMFSGGAAMAPPFRSTPGTVRQIKDAGKISTFGPFLSTSTGTPGALAPGPATSPAIIDYKTPAVVSQYNQPPISHEAPKPIKIEKGIQGDLATATGLLDTGMVWSDVPPCEIDTWYLGATPKGSMTLEVYKAAANTGGFQTDSSGDLVQGSLVLTASLSGQKFASHRFSTSTGTSTNSKPRVEEQSVFLYKLTNISSSTGWQITMNGNRIVPGHPTGFNTAPAVGSKSV